MSFEEQLVDEINELRTTPQDYAQKVRKYIRYFANKTLKIPGSKAGIRTEEGAAAYEEAADYLSSFKVELKPLEPSKGLGRICVDFLEKAKGVDPEDIRSINLEGIIDNYGSFNGSLNRAMDFGGEDPEQVVMNLLVCDGDPNRGNRESLLSTDFNKIGVAFSTHPTYGFCTLIISCTRFKNTYDLNRMGAITNIITLNKLEIKGPRLLKGTKVIATDLRGGASLLIAGLIAEGITEIENCEYILRGYSHITTKLKAIGAKIEITE